jgi:hypothetical protein
VIDRAATFEPYGAAAQKVRELAWFFRSGLRFAR